MGLNERVLAKMTVFLVKDWDVFQSVLRRGLAR